MPLWCPCSGRHRSLPGAQYVGHLCTRDHSAGAREDRQEDTQTGPTDANGFVRVTANGHVARAALLAEGATTDATIASWTGKVEFEFAFLSCDVFGCGVTCGDGGV